MQGESCLEFVATVTQGLMKYADPRLCGTTKYGIVIALSVTQTDNRWTRKIKQKEIKNDKR